MNKSISESVKIKRVKQLNKASDTRERFLKVLAFLDHKQGGAKKPKPGEFFRNYRTDVLSLCKTAKQFSDELSAEFEHDAGESTESRQQKTADLWAKRKATETFSAEYAVVAPIFGTLFSSSYVNKDGEKVKMDPVWERESYTKLGRLEPVAGERNDDGTQRVKPVTTSAVIREIVEDILEFVVRSWCDDFDRPRPSDWRELLYASVKHEVEARGLAPSYDNLDDIIGESYVDDSNVDEVMSHLFG